MKRLLTLIELTLIVGVLLLTMTLAAAPRPITRPIIPTSTPIRQICRPDGFCYRPEPTPRYTPTPLVCKPNPACDPTRESCGMVCY